MHQIRGRSHIAGEMASESPLLQPVRQGIGPVKTLSDQKHVPPGECHLPAPRYGRFIGGRPDANGTWSSTRLTTESPLLADGAVPVEPATTKEAVTHHALGEQKKDDCQDDYKQETSNSEPGWLSSCRVRHIRVTCHLSCLPIGENAEPGLHNSCPASLWVSDMRIELFSFGGLGSWVLGANVGYKFSVPLHHKFQHHFIHSMAKGRPGRGEHPTRSRSSPNPQYALPKSFRGPCQITEFLLPASHEPGTKLRFVPRVAFGVLTTALRAFFQA